MMRSGLAVAALLAPMLWHTASPAAETSCPHRPAILSLSSTALTHRDALPKLMARRAGAEAAFLTIRYTPLDPQASDALLASLREKRVLAADDLILAWMITRHGYAATVAGLGEQSLALLDGSAGVSGIRALLLSAGGTGIMLDRLSALPREKQAGLATTIVAAVIDQPDAWKDRLATAAEAKGALFLAAGLAATEKDAKAWQAFAARQVDKEQLAALTASWYWAPGLVGNPALPRLPENADPAVAAARAQVHSVLIAATLQPDRGFLATYLNMSGHHAEVATAAKAVKTAFDDGILKQKDTLDAGWLFTYRALAAGPDGQTYVDDLLEDISFGFQRYGIGRQPNAGTQVNHRDVIDWLIAADTLKSYVSGAADSMPPVPAGVSRRLADNWSTWMVAAEAVRSGRVPAETTRDEALLGIVAELLMTKGDSNGLATLIASAVPGQTSYAMATDFAMRLDLKCESYFWHPAQSVTLPMQPFYTFDPA